MIRSKYLKSLIRHCAVAFLPWISSSPQAWTLIHSCPFFVLVRIMKVGFFHCFFVKCHESNNVSWMLWLNDFFLKTHQSTTNWPKNFQPKMLFLLFQASNKPSNQPSSTKTGFSKKSKMYAVRQGSLNFTFCGDQTCKGMVILRDFLQNRAVDVKHPVNNGINYQPQLASFPLISGCHQQYNHPYNLASTTRPWQKKLGLGIQGISPGKKTHKNQPPLMSFDCINHIHYIHLSHIIYMNQSPVRKHPAHIRPW